VSPSKRHGAPEPTRIAITDKEAEDGPKPEATAEIDVTQDVDMTQNIDVSQESLNDDEIAVLLERFNQMACLLTGDPDSEAECSYCHGKVALGEALLTAHISGVLAHIKCPAKSLEKVIKKARPRSDFDFEGFSKAVDERVATTSAVQCHGEITVKDSDCADDG
jgi:hypothetical protein